MLPAAHHFLPSGAYPLNPLSPSASPCPSPLAGTLPWRGEREAALGPTATLGSDGVPGSQLGVTSQLGGASLLATSVGGSQLLGTPQEGGQGGSQAKELSKEAVLQVGGAGMMGWCVLRGPAASRA